MTFYELLEVTENASEEVIKAAYKTQATKYHPDNKQTGDEQKMQMLNIAYDVLSDPVKRKQYDQSLQKDHAHREKSESNVKETSFEKENSSSTEADVSKNKEKTSSYNSEYKSSEVEHSTNTSNATKSTATNEYKRDSYFQKKLGFFFRFPVLLFLACIGFPFSLISLVLLFIRHMKLKNDHDYIDREKKMKRTKFYVVILVLVMILVAGCSDLESTSEEGNTTPTEVVDTPTDAENEDVSTEKEEVDTAKEEVEEVVDMEDEVAEEEVVEIEAEETEETEDTVTEEDVATIDAECIADGLYSLYYPTYIVLQYDENMLLNKNKKMKLYIDGDFVVEMVQGDEKVYGMMLEEGTHTIKIKSGWFESEKIQFDVGKYEFYDLNIDNLFYLKMGYKFGDPTVMEFYGTNLPAEGEDVIDTNADIGAGAVYAFVYEAYEPIGDFQEVFSIFEEKYGFENTDMYRSLEKAGFLDE